MMKGALKRVATASVLALSGCMIVTTGFAAWTIATQASGTAQANISADQDMVDIRNAVSISSPTFPKIGRYFFFEDGSNSHSETGSLSYALNFNPANINVKCLKNGHMDFYMAGSLAITSGPSCFIDNSVLSSASLGGSTIDGTYTGSSYDFLVRVQTASSSSENKNLVFTFTNKLIFASRAAVLNKDFVLTLTFGGFVS